MPTLLIRLQGPMQSWGTRSHFDERDTGLEPSKSGVVGLLAAALGRSRGEPIDDLAALHMGVRVDREGIIRYDYQTAMGVFHANGSKAQEGETVQSWRYYLADAVFLVGLEGSDRALLESIDAALRNPRWCLYLGRKGYLPSRPIWLKGGLVAASLVRALSCCPPLVKQPPEVFRFVVDLESAGTIDQGVAQVQLRMDQPLGPFSERRFGARFVKVFSRPREEVGHVSI